MSPALFFNTLKSSRGGIIAWSSFLFLYALLMIYMLQSMAGLAEVMEEYIDKLGAFAEIFAGEITTILNPDGSLSPGKWLSLEYLALWPVMMSVFAVFFGGGIAAKEVERGTMDMLLSQPVSRTSIIISKFVAFPVAIIIVAITSVIGLIVGMAIINNYSDISGIMLAFIPGLLLPLAVASYSLLFSCIFLDPRKVMIAAGSITGLFYILNIVARAVGSLEWMGKLSIFHYYTPAAITTELEMNWVGIGIYLGLIVVSIGASIYVFQRRDIIG